jgi:hypothetical protein
LFLHYQGQATSERESSRLRRFLADAGRPGRRLQDANANAERFKIELFDLAPAASLISVNRASALAWASVPE